MYFKNDNYLIHYGVKGMKWGVRKDKDYILPKGTQVYRVSLTNRKPGRRPAYLYTDVDKDVYEGAFATFLSKYSSPLSGLGVTMPVNKKTYITTKDLTAPSFKKAYEITQNRLKDKKVLQKVTNMGIAMIQNKHPLYTYIKHTSKDKNTFNRKMTFAAYNLMLENDKKEFNQYLKKIKKAGYNSVMDYNNKFIYNKAVEPFITINAKKTLKQISQEKLEDKYIDAAMKRLEKKIGRRPVL